MYLFCRDCRRMFSVTEQQLAKWKGKEPSRCVECWREYKEKSKDPYFGWEGTMASGIHLKHRHQRVHYAPHIVGGFR